MLFHLTLKELPELRPGDTVNVVEFGPGLSVWREGLAMAGLRQQAVYTAEAVESCRAAFKAAWQPPANSMGLWSQQPETGERLTALVGSVELALWGTKCAPWSAAQTVPPEQRTKDEERWLALIELRASLVNLLKARPRCVVDTR